MLTKLLAFFALSQLLGSPWRGLLALLALWWVFDRTTIRLLPGPWVTVRRWVKRRQLEAGLAHNPHDYRAELELGRLLLESRSYPAARPHLEKAAEAYRTDASVQAFRAIDRIGCGEVEEGVRELESLMQANPKLRFGEPWREAAELLLERDPAKAQLFLERFLQMQPSSVKGHYLVARARARSGDAEGSRAARRKAWNEYATNPPFKRRETRVWAYRANPIRPALYALGLFAALGMVAVLVRFR